MKNITTFLLGGLVFISFAAATTSIMTVKPATPKSTVVLQTSWGTIDSTQKRILEYVSKGYIVKSTVSVDTRALIVMEKY